MLQISDGRVLLSFKHSHKISLMDVQFSSSLGDISISQYPTRRTLASGAYLFASDMSLDQGTPPFVSMSLSYSQRFVKLATFDTTDLTDVNNDVVTDLGSGTPTSMRVFYWKVNTG